MSGWCVWLVCVCVCLQTAQQFALPSVPDGINVSDLESRFTFSTDLPPPEEWTDEPRAYPSQTHRKRAGAAIHILCTCTMLYTCKCKISTTTEQHSCVMHVYIHVYHVYTF